MIYVVHVFTSFKRTQQVMLMFTFFARAHKKRVSIRCERHSCAESKSMGVQNVRNEVFISGCILKVLYSILNEISNNRLVALNRVFAILNDPISPVLGVCSLLQALTFQPSITQMLSLVMLSGKENLS